MSKRLNFDTIRRAQITKEGQIGAGYFKPGQFVYVIAETTEPGMYVIDREGCSLRGEVTYLVSKTKEMRGGALYVSGLSIRFTQKRQKNHLTTL